jgi:hypothetical protein
MRLQWTRQFAQIDSIGMLHITSSAVYDKRCYSLLGGNAILVDSPVGENAAASSPPRIQIRLDPSRQLDGETNVVLRLFTTADAALWISALSRFSFSMLPPPTSAVPCMRNNSLEADFGCSDGKR